MEPKMTVYLNESVLALLAEQVAVAAMHGCDENGLKLLPRGDFSKLPEIARKAVADYLDCEVAVVQGI